MAKPKPQCCVPTCAQPTTELDESGSEIFKISMEHGAWPLLAILALLISRRPLLTLLGAIADRAMDRRVPFEVGTEGLKFGGVQDGRIEVQSQAIEQLRVIVAQTVSTQGIAPEAGQGSPAEQLDELATYYLNHKFDDDLRKRTSEKDAVGRQMGALVFLHGLSRAQLAASRNEGKILALAYAVLSDPRSEDVPLLLGVAAAVTRLHVRYALAMAFGRLLEARLMSEADREALPSVLMAMRRGADDALIRRLNKTLALAIEPT